MYLQDAKREMLKYKSNLLRPASLNTRGEYKHTFTYSLCNMNLIISVIDSLMSAGSVCRRRKKKKKTALLSNIQLRKIILLSI